jgi:hypothetical protein
MSDNKEFDDKKIAIHTLESDLASAVNNENYGKNIIKIVTDENKNSIFNGVNVEERVNSSRIKNWRNLIIFLVVIILLGSGTYVVYVLNKANNLPIDDLESAATTTDTSIKNPILSDKNILNPEVIQSSDFSNLNKFEIISEINKIKQLLTDKSIAPGNNISVNTNLNIVQFFEKIRYSGEQALLRSLDNNYVFGLYSVGSNDFESYILIQINDFDLAFKSILGWEKYMYIDLKDIFVTIPKNSNSTSTLTRQNTEIFVDRILKNYDIREYINNDSGVDIIYGFINNKYLLITSGESSFIDIKDRLLKENISR